VGLVDRRSVGPGVAGDGDAVQVRPRRPLTRGRLLAH
jgi:hypothetical protein